MYIEVINRETVNKLEDVHRSYKYYLPWDLQTEFDFKKPLYWYTEIYVVWDDIHLVSFDYWTGIDRWTVAMWGCTVEEGGVWVDKTNNSCEVELPEINSITWYNTPLWYKKWTEIAYSTSKITLTWDVELEAKANANHYTINFKPWTWTWNMNSQEFVYDEVWILNKNSFIKTWYYFSGWIDDNWVEYSNGQKVLNLLTEWSMNLTAQWSLIPPSAWWWSVINNQPTEKEHNSAELTWINKEIEVEQVKPQPTKTNTNTTKESTKQESSTTHSSTSQSQIDPEILTAYEWAKSKDITTIQTLDEAMPDGVVKRWHLAKMVVNYATNILWREIPEKIPS